MSAAFGYAVATLRQIAHCIRMNHEPHDRRIGDRLIAIECRSCGKVFWRKRGW